MKVLVVCSYRSYAQYGVAPFIYEQVEMLRRLGVEIDYYLLHKKGIGGYLKERKGLIDKINEFHPDIIHAHFGLCGLLANLQRKVPVVTTYHGSDINNSQSYRFSRWAIKLSQWNIFVSPQLVAKANPKEHYSVLPCGIDLSLLRQLDKTECRKQLGLDLNKHYVLFSKMFTDPIKNYPLAKASVDKMHNKAELLEFIGYSREQVPVLMNAVDAVIMTSLTEGSPQFIKEAMACNTPIVSVEVGDVKSVIEGTDGCYLAERNADDIASKLDKAVLYGKTKGRDKIVVFDQKHILEQIYNIYKKVLNETH